MGNPLKSLLCAGRLVVDSAFRRQAFPAFYVAKRLADRKTGFARRALLNGMPYSQYAYCLYHGCELAARLGIREVSAIEFGVAGGNGLVALEKHACEVEKALDVKISVYGFDTGSGLTPPQDYRDMPYFFATGNYRMDEAKLRGRLTRSHLVLGDVKQTVRAFAGQTHPPLAAAFFDLDYYSSTVDALRLLSLSGAEGLLPRVFTYFDDTVGDERKLYNEFTGELLAIKEFNEANRATKIAAARHLLGRTPTFPWYHQIFIVHCFEHPLYNQFVSTHTPESLTLRDR